MSFNYKNSLAPTLQGEPYRLCFAEQGAYVPLFAVIDYLRQIRKGIYYLISLPPTNMRAQRNSNPLMETFETGGELKKFNFENFSIYVSKGLVYTMNGSQIIILIMRLVVMRINSSNNVSAGSQKMVINSQVYHPSSPNYSRLHYYINKYILSGCANNGETVEIQDSIIDTYCVVGTYSKPCDSIMENKQFMRKIVKYVTDNTLIEEVVEAEVPQEVVEERPFGQASTSLHPFAEDEELITLERAIAQYLPFENSLDALQRNRLQELRATYANRRDFLVRQTRTETARREAAVHSGRRRGVNINVIDDTVSQRETVSENLLDFNIFDLEEPSTNPEPVAHVETNEEHARRVIEEQGLSPDSISTRTQWLTSDAPERTSRFYRTTEEGLVERLPEPINVHDVAEAIERDREIHEANSTFVPVEESVATYGFVDDESQILPYARPDNE